MLRREVNAVIRKNQRILRAVLVAPQTKLVEEYAAVVHFLAGGNIAGTRITRVIKT